MEFELENCRLEMRVRALEEVVKMQSEALRESSKLLQRTRPPRPPIPHDRKLQIAAEQRWKCADPTGDCILYRLSDGTFDATSLFEIDHIEPWHTSFRTVGQCQALCITCHNAKTRRERLLELDQAVEEAAKSQP